MQNQKLKIENSNGESLHATLELPAGKKVLQYAIFAHCFTCSSNFNIVRNISRELTNYGFGVVRFDFTGLGSSEGDFEDTNFSHNIEDLKLVNDYLKENFEAPTLIIGHSLGGAAALISAASLANLKAVATIGAPSEPAHVTHLLKGGLDSIQREGKAEVSIGGRPFVINKQFLDDLEKQNLKKQLKKMRKPILILHSPQDKIVSLENAAEIYQAAHHPKSFVSLDGADHLLSNDEDSIYASKIIATWAARYLHIEDSQEETHLSPDEAQVVGHLVLENKFTTQISNGRHTIVADEPASLEGEDLGFAPFELLSAGLAACTNMTLRLYANHKKWPLTEVFTYIHHHQLEEVVEKEGKKEKIKTNHISKKIELIGDLTQEQKERLLEIAEKCPVNKSLQASFQIESELM